VTGRGPSGAPWSTQLGFTDSSPHLPLMKGSYHSTWLSHGTLQLNLEQRQVLDRHQPAYSIRARDLASHSKAGCMAAIFSCNPKPKKTLGIERASMYATEPLRKLSGKNGVSPMTCRIHSVSRKADTSRRKASIWSTKLICPLRASTITFEFLIAAWVSSTVAVLTRS
jgi:hypothetical protein